MINKVTLVVYVNNLLIVKKNKENILDIKKLLKQKFDVKDLGEVQIVFGIMVKSFK